ncbi:MAG TPA: hypothetical protein VMF32_22870 [Xanthobacteraceae bacterium]|nr:hypothetical protein [Xanthobacteraceae bacterium]
MGTGDAAYILERDGEQSPGLGHRVAHAGTEAAVACKPICKPGLVRATRDMIGYMKNGAGKPACPAGPTFLADGITIMLSQAEFFARRAKPRRRASNEGDDD